MRSAGATLAVLLAASPVCAADQAVIAMNGCGDGVTAAATRSLRDALIRNGASMQSEDETARPLGGLSRGSIADAERLLASARYDLFERGAYDRVEASLRSALNILEVAPPSDARGVYIRDGLTMLALLDVKQNRAAAAEEALGRVLRVVPDYRPDQNLYPPSFRNLADKVRAKVRKDANKPLAISSRPAGLRVFIDGLPAGVTPLTVKLPGGRYQVEASYGGRRGAPKTVAVEGSGGLELDEAVEGAVFADDGPCIAAGTTRDERLAAVVRTASVLDVGQVVAIRFEEPAGGERYFVASVVDARTGQETREARVKVGRGGGPPQTSIASLANFLTTGEAAAPVEPVSGGAAKAQAPVPAPPMAVARTEPAPESTSLRTGAYVAGGAGAAALLASGYFFLTASGAQARISTLCGAGSCVDGSRAEVAQLAPQAASQRTTGALLAGAGAAALAAGVVLYVLEPDRSESPSAELTLLPSGARVAVTF